MKKFLAKILLLSLVCIFTLTCFGCGGKQTAEITFWVYSTEGALVDADDYKYDEVKLNIDLYKRSAPKTVEQFKKLAKEGYYNDTFFYILNDYESQFMLGDLKYNGEYTMNGTTKVYDIVKNAEVDTVKGEFEKNGVQGSELKNTKYAIGLWRTFEKDSSSFSSKVEQTYDSGSATTYFLQSDISGYNGYFAVFAQVAEDYKQAFDDLKEIIVSSKYYEDYVVYYTGTDPENLEFHVCAKDYFEEDLASGDKIENFFEPEEGSKYYKYASYGIWVPKTESRIVVKNIKV